MKKRSDLAIVLAILLVIGGVIAGFFVGGSEYKPLTQTNFASSISKAAEGAKSMHFAMTGARVNVTADFSFGDSIAMQMAMSANVDGKNYTINTKIVNGAAYMQVPPAKWVSLGSTGSGAALQEQYKNLGPQGLASQFDSGVKSVTYVGKTILNGETSYQYAVVVDAAQLGASLTSLAQSVPAFKDVKTVTEQVYLNDKNVLQRWEITLPDPVGTMTIDFSNWNTPVTVQAPAASDLDTSSPAPAPGVTPVP